MSKIQIISLISVVVIVGGVFLVSKNNKNTLPTEQMQLSEETTESKNGSGKKMSFATFLEQDKEPYECTVSQYIDEGMTQTTEGRVFLHAGRIRGNFETKVSGINIETSTIVRDGFVYTWTNMSQIGFKSKVVDGETVGNTNQSGTYSWNAEQIGEYNCQPWSPQESQFEIPNIVFQEV